MIDRNRLIEAVDRAFDSHVERVFSSHALSDGGASADVHMRAGLRAAMDSYARAIDVVTELTPNG